MCVDVFGSVLRFQSSAPVSAPVCCACGGHVMIRGDLRH